MSNPIFRQKSIEKISSPELAAVIILLAGIFVWGLFGRLDTAFQTGGVCKDGYLTVYVSEKDFAKINEEAIISVDESEFALSEIPGSPVQLDDSTDPYLLHLIGASAGDWVYVLSVDASGIKDGTFSVSIITERVRPLDFVLN